MPLNVTDSNFLNPPSTIPTSPKFSGPNSELIKIKFLKFGREIGVELEMSLTGLEDKLRDCNRFKRGKLEMEEIELSEKSIESN